MVEKTGLQGRDRCDLTMKKCTGCGKAKTKGSLGFDVVVDCEHIISFRKFTVEHKSIDELAYKPLLDLTLSKIIEIEEYMESKGKKADLIKVVEDIVQIRKELESRGTRPAIILKNKGGK